MSKLLEVKDLKIEIEVKEGTLHPVRGIDFSLASNETLGIVGESGSGKSLSMKAIMGMLPFNSTCSGSIIYKGQELVNLKEDKWLLIRGHEIAYVNQNPSSNLNPIIKVGKQMQDAILPRLQLRHKYAKKYLNAESKTLGINLLKLSDNEIFNYLDNLYMDESELEEFKKKIINNRNIYFEDISKESIKNRCIALLRDVGVDQPESRLEQYPFELSGGMKQRIVIAIALSGTPSLVIFDEPTTSLDVTIQAQILMLIKKIQQEKHFSLIFISHNLAVISKICKRVIVMYAGKFLESGSIEQVFNKPVHPYTKALLKAIPSLDKQSRLYSIPGTSVNLIDVEDIDQFAYRNESPLEIDFKKEPPLFEVEKGHFARTWLAHEYAPKVKEVKDKEVDGIERVNNNQVVLEVRNLSKTFYNKYGESKACREINLSLHQGEILAVVGESGSGKTTLAKILTGLLKQDKGEVILEDKVLSGVSKNGKYQYDYSRITDVQMIFQDSSEALNPRMTVGECILEGIELSKKYSKEEAIEKVRELLKEVDLDESILSRYPYMISGGQRQRVQIARALAVSPKVLIADEPVSDLDVSIQANVLHLFDKIRKDKNISIIFISHDLSVVKYIADKVAVFYCGRLLEYGHNIDVFSNPLHSYTKSLLNSVPTINLEQDLSLLEKIPYSVTEDGTYVVKGHEHIVYEKE